MTDQDITKFTGATADDENAPPLGAVIADRWELVDHLGEGGMSNVYKGRHVIMHKFGAVKFLKGGFANDPIAVKRFQGEALAAGTLSHRNIVQVYDCGLCEYGAYLIMEILPGVSLIEVMEARAHDAPDGLGILGLKEALPIFLQICDGLDHAHKKGIIHRDVKPSNIMLIEPDVKQSDDPEEVQVKLVDFGLAKMVGADGTTADGRLTATGEVFGSPVYMSPEHCLGRDLDGRSDIYSLGCLMYECVTGKKVLIGPTSTETMIRHVEEDADLRGLAEIKHPLAKQFALIVEKCLRRDPIERYNHVGELRAALQKLDAGLNPGRMRSSAGKNRSWQKLGLVATGLLLSLAVSLVAYSEWPVAAVSSNTSALISIPVKDPIKNNTISMMSPRLFTGGAGVVAHLQVPPERIQSTCQTVLMKGDEDLASGRFDDAAKRYEFVSSVLRDSGAKFAGIDDLLLQATVGYTVATSQLQDLDGLDIGLGNLIKSAPEYYNAGDAAKRYALRWRARVQKDNRGYGAAAVTIKQMLSLYPSGDDWSKLGLSSEEIRQRALWTGLLADLLRLTNAAASDDKGQRQEMLTDYKNAMVHLDLPAKEISDAKYESEVKTFQARLNYRWGLALLAAGDYPAAQEAFQTSLHLFKQQESRGVPLAGDIEAARVQSYLALKHYDFFGSLKYRLQNHL